MAEVTKGIEGDSELRSADLMALKLKDPSVAAALTNASNIDALAEASKQKVIPGPLAQALTFDRKVYMAAVLFLGSVGLISLLGIIGLSAALGSDNLPDSLVSIVSTAVGALAGLLNPLGMRQNN